MALGRGKSMRCAVGAIVLGGAVVAGGGEPLPSQDAGVVIGCPSPSNEFERPQTATDATAVLMLFEALTLCDDELITHGEDREFQKRLALQAMLEKIERQRAREALVAQRRSRPAVQMWHADPSQTPPR